MECTLANMRVHGHGGTLANMRVHGHGVYTVSVDCSLKFPIANFSAIKGISTLSLSRQRVK